MSSAIEIPDHGILDGVEIRFTLGASARRKIEKLVGGLEHFLEPTDFRIFQTDYIDDPNQLGSFGFIWSDRIFHIVRTMIPTDELIFFSGVAQAPTRK